MMKKELWSLLLIFLLLPEVVALSVSLTAPTTGNVTNMTSIILSCTATEPTFTINAINLYMNTSSSAWIQVSTQSNSSTTANFLITNLAQGTYIWNCFALNTNNENISATSNNSLTISSLGFSGIIPNLTVTEDTNSSTLFDLDTYFTGANTFSFSGNTSLIFLIDTNNQVSISPAANFSGTQNVTITATAGTITKSSNEILINVTNGNDAPQRIADFSNITLEKNSNTTLDMKDYFTDIDKNTNLTYTLTLASHIILTQNSTKITLIPETDWEGKENATISASDGTVSVSSNLFTITIGSTTNTTPVISSYSPDGNPTLERGDTQDFSISASDTDSLTITWYVNQVAQTDTDESFSYTATEEGVITIEVIVSNGNEQTSHAWTVTIGTEFNTDTDVESILTEQTTNPICGNGLEESGETCSSCALDVSCQQGYICNNGTCEPKKSATKAILILVLVSIGIVLVGLAIYYFTSIKKGDKGKENQTFQYTPIGTRPPTDYTDFYREKK